MCDIFFEIIREAMLPIYDAVIREIFIFNPNIRQVLLWILIITQIDDFGGHIGIPQPIQSGALVHRNAGRSAFQANRISGEDHLVVNWSNFDRR